MASLTPEAIHAFKMAIQNELDTIQIYQQMLNRVRNAKTKEMLKVLIEEEHKHEKRIRDKMKDYSDEVSFSEPDSDIGLPNREKLLELELNNCTISELINLAIENEKISRDFYQAQCERADNKEVEKIFLWLVAQEIEHIKNLKSEYNRHQYFEEVKYDDDSD